MFSPATNSQALINEITDEAEAVPRPLTDKEKAAVAKCTAAKAAKEAADAATFTPLRAVDAQVMDRIGKSPSPSYPASTGKMWHTGEVCSEETTKHLQY